MLQQQGFVTTASLFSGPIFYGKNIRLSKGRRIRNALKITVNLR
jgi:hypothetical protein